LRSNRILPAPFSGSLFDVKQPGVHRREPRNAALLSAALLGLVLLASDADLYLRAGAEEPPRGQDPRPSSGPAAASKSKTVTGDLSAGAPKPRTATPRTSTQVFRAECLKCHDDDGSGGAARDIFPSIPDFRDPKWQDSRRDVELSRSILEGKGKAMRPMKNTLGASEVHTLVTFIRGFRGGKQVVPDEPQGAPSGTHPGSTAGAAHAPPQVTRTSMKVESGGRLFQQLCVKCHESNGTGTEMRPRAPAIPNFTDPKWHAQRSEHQLVVSILDGKGTRMPGFRGRIGDKEAHDLITFIRAMSPTQAQSPDSSPTEFESRFRQLEREFDVLQQELRRLDPSDDD
jgi:mono/diheme cytochrome c family protein